MIASEPASGYWYTAQELRRVNKQLQRVNRRICRTHQSAALPLDEDHFYYQNRAAGRFETECRVCHAARSAANHQRRYWENPCDRARQRAASACKYQQRKAARLGRILATGKGR